MRGWIDVAQSNRERPPIFRPTALDLPAEGTVISKQPPRKAERLPLRLNSLGSRSSSACPCEWKNCSSRPRRRAYRSFPGHSKSIRLARNDGGQGRAKVPHVQSAGFFGRKFQATSGKHWERSLICPE